VCVDATQFYTFGSLTVTWEGCCEAAYIAAECGAGTQFGQFTFSLSNPPTINMGFTSFYYNGRCWVIFDGPVQIYVPDVIAPLPSTLYADCNVCYATTSTTTTTSSGFSHP
jgi:hypothetical protein